MKKIAEEERNNNNDNDGKIEEGPGGFTSSTLGVVPDSGHAVNKLLLLFYEDAFLQGISAELKGDKITEIQKTEKYKKP